MIDRIMIRQTMNIIKFGICLVTTGKCLQNHSNQAGRRDISLQPRIVFNIEVSAVLLRATRSCQNSQAAAFYRVTYSIAVASLK